MNMVSKAELIQKLLNNIQNIAFFIIYIVTMRKTVKRIPRYIIIMGI